MEKKEFTLSFDTSKSIDVEFQNVFYKTKERGGKKVIINGVSGKFVAGELTAIMGPSGAGKTTLLNILTGLQVTGTKGTIISTNRGKMKTGALQYKKESCYILQDDNLPPLFSVLEIMNIAANLKLCNISEKARDFLIYDILDNLSLLNCKNTRCNHLSGGQRKRLSVALELLDNPPIMFLDEPTSGLDSSSTTQCVQMLKHLAAGGRTIICTIHQPSAVVYEMFNHVYILAQGRCVYQGASTNTIPYLSSVGFNCPQYHNPADYLLEVICGEYGGNYTDTLVEAATDKKWRNTVPKIQIIDAMADIRQTEPVVYNGPYQRNVTYDTPSEWTRFWILLYRCGIQLFRDWTVSQLKLILHLLVAVFLGLTYQQCGREASKVINNLGLMFCSVVYLTYTSLMPSVLKFPSELAVLKKERFNNWYKLKTYYAAFLISDIPIQIAFSLAYTCTSYFLTAQPYEYRRFLMVLIIQILVALSASSFGLLLGTVANPVNGTFFGAITLAVMLCVSGLLIFFTHMSKAMYLLTYLSFMSYAVDGIMQALYGYNRSPLQCPEESDYCHYKYPEMLLKDLGMDKPNYWIDVGYLVSTFIFLRAIAFCTLKRKLSSV